MRAKEIMTESEVPYELQPMLLKMRKGSAAGLTVKTLQAIFALPAFHGWTIENAKIMRPSNGGWVLRDTPIGEVMRTQRGGRERGQNGHFVIDVTYNPQTLKDESNVIAYNYEVRRKADVEEALAKYQAVAQQPMAKKGRWEIQNFRIIPVKTPNEIGLKVEFDFYTMNSVYNITSPEGEEFLAGGDHKNGSVVQNNLPDQFFKWAVENTNFLDSVLLSLNMEPHTPKADPKSRYTPPSTASEEEKNVYALLTKMTDDIAADQRKEYGDYCTKQIERFIDLRKAGDKEQIKTFAKRYKILLNVVWDGEAKSLYGNWQAKMDKYVAEVIQGMQNMFVRKNTRKLASILTAKGNLKTEKVISIRATNQGTIDARLAFTFEDGSSFVTTQSTEWSYTVDGWGRPTDPFLRFPTRFHDVTFADGSKMKNPSEEQMNTVFVGGSADAE